MAIVDFSKLTDISFLTENPTTPMKSAIFFLVFFTLSIIVAIVLSILAEKKNCPKFYKKYLLRFSDFFLYIPIVGIILVLTRIGGISGLDKRINLLILLALWLIWFIFMVYYRLFIVSALWAKYYTRQKQEGYLKNGKKS